MTLQIELGREMEEVLENRARLQGMPVEDYALQVLQQAVSVEPNSRPRAQPRKSSTHFSTQWRTKEQRALPANTSTFSREMIYDDHD